MLISEKSLICLLNKVKNKYGAEQVIFVWTENTTDFQAKMSVFEKNRGEWTCFLSSIDTVIGKNGFTLDKLEGDRKSPAGIFRLTQAFGIPEKPEGIKIPYKKTSENDYWIDDADSSDYNRWVHFEGDPCSRWKSFERLMIPPYKYAIVIEYNTEPVVKGKGSAIFLHVWSGASSPSAGCITISESNIMNLLKWLDPLKNPVIVQGTKIMINDMIDCDAK